jgi:hypothetical protein
MTMAWGITRMWNTFSAIPTLGTLTVLPGKGGYEWDEVHQYTVRRLKRDCLQFTDKAFLRESLEFWRSAEPRALTYTSASTKPLSVYMFGVYAYNEGEDLDQVIANFVENQLSPEIASGYGLEDGYKARVSSCARQEGDVLAGVVDMRIDLLHQRIGVPRTARSLSDARLLEMDEALEANWEAMCHMAVSPLLGDDERTEAAHLVYRLGLMRLDLYDRAKERGIPIPSDPDVAHN